MAKAQMTTWILEIILPTCKVSVEGQKRKGQPYVLSLSSQDLSERMWLVVVATATLVMVVDCQKRPTISFISGAGSGEVVTDLGKSAELICQVAYPIGLMTMTMAIMTMTLRTA